MQVVVLSGSSDKGVTINLQLKHKANLHVFADFLLSFTALSEQDTSGLTFLIPFRVGITDNMPFFDFKNMSWLKKLYFFVSWPVPRKLMTEKKSS